MVTLGGEVSEAESLSVPRAIGRMPGVASVENRLTVREASPGEGQGQAQAQGPGAPKDSQAQDQPQQQRPADPGSAPTQANPQPGL